MTGPRAGAAALVAALSFSVLGCRVPRPERSPMDGGDPEAEASAPVRDAALPADDTLPAGADEELTVRGRHLLEAIARDDADLAADLLLPRDGWVATHDATDPGKEWIKRVAGPFRRAIHALARRHRGFDRARFVSFELGHAMSQVTPRRRSWSKPLWTIHDSKLTFEVDGRTGTIDVREMVAWRGAWYVTRLR